MSAKEETRQFILPEELKRIPVNRDVAISLLRHIIENQNGDLVITYGELASKICIDFKPRDLRDPLGVVSNTCIKNDLPPISSIVVNKDTRLPEEGFYKQFYLGVNWQRDMQKIFEENKLAIINCTIWKDFLEEIEQEKLEIPIENADKELMIERIDKILDQVPPKRVKYKMNHRVEDFIYNTSLLQSNLENKVCNKCEKTSMCDCNNCTLYLKKEELISGLKKAKRKSRKNNSKDKFIKFFIFCFKKIITLLIIFIALFGITFNSIVKEIFYNECSYTAIKLREQNLECLRIDFSREYIESKLGKPKSISKIEIAKKSYFRTAYVDKFYTLLCYYNDIGSLLGYMIISNSSDFRYQCYRSDIKLLENSVSEARNILEKEKIQSQPITSDNFSGDRIDNSKYYYECKMQHSLGGQETCYIGFGFVDIGYLANKIEPNMDPENVKINFITVFSEYKFSESDNEEMYYMIDFIKKHVIDDGFAGLSKGSLTNLSEDVDFNDKIKEYLGFAE